MLIEPSLDDPRTEFCVISRAPKRRTTMDSYPKFHNEIGMAASGPIKSTEKPPASSVCDWPVSRLGKAVTAQRYGDPRLAHDRRLASLQLPVMAPAA